MLIGIVDLKYCLCVFRNFFRYELFLVKICLLKFLFIIVVLYILVVRDVSEKMIIIILVVGWVKNFV